MKPGDLLKALDEFMEPDRFFHFLADHKLGAWNSLDVNYEPPQVHRMWVQHGDYRVNLHRIFPCEKALYHPHPWPSAIHVLDGEYEMGVGTNRVEAARVVLAAGSRYEMLDILGWHYVRPLKEPSLSLMLTWAPHKPQWYDHENFGKDRRFQELTNAQQEQLLEDFKLGSNLSLTMPRAPLGGQLLGS